MNIKNLAGINPLIAPVVVQTKRKSQGTSPDRDSNGRRDGDSATSPRRLSDEEFEQCLSLLANLEGVKNNNLQIKTQILENTRIVILISPLGEVIRRIPESDLAYLLADSDRKSGNILDKAM